MSFRKTPEPKIPGLDMHLYSKKFRSRLSFRELRCSTSCFETVLLTFFHTWVTCKESSSFENWSVFCVCLKKGSCNTMSDGTSLSCVSATFNVNENVKFAFCFCCSQWLTNDNFRVSNPKYSSMSLLLIVILPVPGVR